MFMNVVIGKPLVEPSSLLAANGDDWESTEKKQTLFTNERFLPAILKEAGIVGSISEVRRNQPKLVKTLDNIGCMQVKWGKKHLFIIIGE